MHTNERTSGPNAILLYRVYALASALAFFLTFLNRFFTQYISKDSHALVRTVSLLKIRL